MAQYRRTTVVCLPAAAPADPPRYMQEVPISLPSCSKWLCESRCGGDGGGDGDDDRAGLDCMKEASLYARMQNVGASCVLCCAFRLGHFFGKKSGEREGPHLDPESADAVDLIK